MTQDEIKKLASEYVSQHQITPTEAYYENKRILETQDVLPILKWLSEGYAIVPKSKLREIYDCYAQHEQVTDKKGLYEAMLIARGSMAAMRDIYGREIFEDK